MPENAGLYVNTYDVGWTPQSSSRSVINHITQSAVDRAIRNIAFSGDGDVFPSFRTNVAGDPSVSFQGGNVGRFLAIAQGQKGTVDWTIGDAANGAHVGAIKYTLINALLGSNSSSQANQQFGGATATFESFSSDGVTNPLSYTYLSS